MLIKICALKKQKIMLMEEIYKTTLEQSQYLNPEKVDELLTAIDKKQQYIDSIDKINAELLPLEKKVSNYTERRGGEETNRLYEEKLEEIRLLGEKATMLAVKIQKVEEQNLQTVSNEFQNLRREINSLYQRKGSFKAYRGSSVQTNGYFIDNRE